MRILTFTSLYPNEVQQNHGLFVEHRLSNFLRYRPQDEAKVVAPVPWFPSRSTRFGQYSKYASVPASETRKGIEIVHPRFFHIPRIGMSISPILLAISSLGTIQRLLASGWNFDVIDAHYFFPDGVAAVLLAQRLNKPVVITARGSDINVLPTYCLPRRMIQWAAKKSDAVITVSEALRQSLLSLGVSSNCVTTIHNGVDLDFFKPRDKNEARAKLGIHESARLIVSVGNLVKLKDHPLLIKAMPRLRTDIVLKIIGDGPLKSEYTTLIEDLSLEDRVSLVGSVPQDLLPYYYSAADALVHTSSSEGMANVWLEALACGTGVVTSAVGGASEVICSDTIGRLVPERTPEAFAEAVAAFLANGASRSAIRSYATRFSWKLASTQQAEINDRVTSISAGPLPNQT